MRRKNLDRRNPAGGIAEGLRTVRKGNNIPDSYPSSMSESSAGTARYVSDLIRSLHPDSSESRYLAVFRFFVDESGIHKSSKIFVLAGFFAPEEVWVDFTGAWQAVLDTHGIEVFHAKECNASEGEFKKFKQHREERNAFVIDLLKVISDRPRIEPFYTGVILDDYQTVMRQYPDYEHPYYACMKWVFSEIGLLMEMAGVPTTEIVASVFDRQKKFSEQALTLFDEMVEDKTWGFRERFDSIAFASKRRFKPLQAADALAYDAYREFNRRCFTPNQPQRRSFTALTANRSKDIQFSGALWDRKFLEWLASHPGMMVDRHKK